MDASQGFHLPLPRLRSVQLSASRASLGSQLHKYICGARPSHDVSTTVFHPGRQQRPSYLEDSSVSEKSAGTFKPRSQWCSTEENVITYCDCRRHFCDVRCADVAVSCVQLHDSVHGPITDILWTRVLLFPSSAFVVLQPCGQFLPLLLVWCKIPKRSQTSFFENV